jgi:hypothetical protein
VANRPEQFLKSQRNVPSHYFLLVITDQMTSSPFGQPGGDVGCVVFLDFRSDFEGGAKECRAQLGDPFLPGVALVTPHLAAEVAIQPRRVFGAMDVSCASVA